MTFPFFIQVFLLVAFSFSIFLAVILVVSKKHRSISNSFLAIFLVTYAFKLLLNSNFSPKIGFGNFLVVILLLTPSLYLYVWALTKKINIFKLKFLWHYLPAISMIPILYFFRQRWEVNIYEDVFSKKEALLFFSILQAFTIIQVIIYLLLTIKHLNTYKYKIEDNFSNISKINLNLLTNLCYTFLLIMFFWVFVGYGDIGYFIKLWGEPSMYTAYILWFSMSFVVLLIGYHGFTRPEILLNLDTNLFVKPKANKKYSPKELKKYSLQLTELMQHQKPFLDPTLKLSQLAELMVVNPVFLSAVINTCFEKNFNDFINEYRVREVIGKIENSKFKNLTLLGLAYESGFNSKSTFNTMFKKFTGKTPNDFKKELSGKKNQISPRL